jgi:class 3 adenylate cyclase
VREEQRTITALFADLAGSTALGERLDAEEFKLVVGGAVGRVSGEVERFGGFVKSIAGDGVLAFFGAPVSYEDDAERAARAALSILVAMAEYGSEVARGWGIAEFGVRVGICTGPVAVGLVGSGMHVEYAAYGDTVNTAARLQSAAEAGTVLVDGRTQRLIEPLFIWSEPQEFELKGKAEPVRAFCLRGSLPGRSTLRGLAGVSTPTVGREGELASLSAALQKLFAGAGGVAALVGEAGLGKSRLLANLKEEATAGGDPERPLLWLKGGCLSYGEGLPYFPFRDLLRGWLGVSEADPALRVQIALHRMVEQLFDGSAAEVSPYLASLLGMATAGDSGARLLALSAEELQQRTFAAVERLAERLAQDRPVVLALEDLHWADATSIQLTRSLVPLIERAAVLLVFTQRDERDHASWALKEAVSRDFPHLIREIRLEPLPFDAERTLLDELIGAGTLPDELERRVLEAADGNPLYLEELVRSLADAGAIVQRNGHGWRLDHTVPIVIPETVAKVILARADRLSSEARTVLAAASVLGRQFDSSLLAQLVSTDLRLQETLHQLQRLGFIALEGRWPQPQYRFKHALIQEAIYSTIPTEERKRLHRVAAESLEKNEQDTQESLLDLAHHWLEAGVPDRAIPYYKRGAEQALRVFANEEAVEAITQALDLLARTHDGPARDAEELELRTMLGVALVALGGYGLVASQQNYLRARDLCFQLGQPVSPPILRGLAISSVTRLELDDAKEHGLALLTAAERDHDSMLMVEAQYALGVTSFWKGEFQNARRHLQEAIAHYSPEHHEAHLALYSQDPKVICLIRLAWTLWFLGYPDQAANARDDALALAEELGHPFSRCYATVYGALISHDLQDTHRFEQLLEAAETLTKNERFHLFHLFATVLRHSTLARNGDPDAIDAMKAAISRIDETGQPLNNTYFLSMLAHAYLRTSNPAAGLDTVTEALDDSHRTNALYAESELQRLRGQLLQAAGADPADIEAAFRLATEIAQRQEAKALELRAAVEHARWLEATQGSVAQKNEALRLVENVYRWFTEGHQTPELQSARQLLDHDE